MIKMSRIIFALRCVVVSYQNGFGGNDLERREAMIGRGGGSQHTTGEGCGVCHTNFLTIFCLTIISALSNQHKAAVHDATCTYTSFVK